MNFNILSLIIFLPALGAIIIACISNSRAKLIKYIAAVFTLIPLILGIIVFFNFDKSASMAGVMQFQEKASWIPLINAYYHVGLDGISLPLFLLMDFLGFLVVLNLLENRPQTEGIFCLAAVTGNQYFGRVCFSRYFTVLHLLGN